MSRQSDPDLDEDEPLPIAVARTFRQSMITSIVGGVVGLILAVVPIALIVSFESMRGWVESNTYAVEAVDRQAFAATTYQLLFKSARAQGGTTTVWTPQGAWCNQAGTVPVASPFQEQGPAGTLLTLRYTRTETTDAVSFDAKGGRFVFVGTQGDSPAQICFNESRTRVTIRYDANTKELDTGPPGRVLFVQMDEPGADISSETLRDKLYVYLAIAVSFISFFALLLAILGLLIWYNGNMDAGFRRNSSETQKALHRRIKELDRRIEVLQRRVETTAGDQEKKSNALFLRLNSLQNDLQRNLKDVLEKNLDEFAAASSGAVNPKAKVAISHQREVGAADSRHVFEAVVKRTRTPAKPKPADAAEASSVNRIRTLIRRPGD